LVQAALAKATRREDDPRRPQNRITKEDVTWAAPDFLKQREDDLRVDASRTDVERLHHRLNDVLHFCLNIRRVNVFLVESRFLREELWGRDISALSDLRFFHRIGNLTVKSSEPIYVGKRYEAFAIDLSSYARTRVRTTEIDFWTTEGFQKVRAASHVYTPDIAQTADKESIRSARSSSNYLEQHQESLFPAVAQAEADAEELDLEDI
jgi:hypothetical protein